MSGDVAVFKGWDFDFNDKKNWLKGLIDFIWKEVEIFYIILNIN